jgi:hypothetical protein
VAHSPADAYAPDRWGRTCSSDTHSLAISAAGSTIAAVNCLVIGILACGFQSLYSAAEIDGANNRRRMYHQPPAKVGAPTPSAVPRAMTIEEPSPIGCPVRFSVITANETETVYDGTFKVEDSGMLIISPDNEEEPVIRLSPAFWRQINEPRSSDDLLESAY